MLLLLHESSSALLHRCFLVYIFGTSIPTYLIILYENCNYTCSTCFIMQTCRCSLRSTHSYSCTLEPYTLYTHAYETCNTHIRINSLVQDVFWQAGATQLRMLILSGARRRERRVPVSTCETFIDALELFGCLGSSLHMDGSRHTCR